jgi:hypothetical protein
VLAPGGIEFLSLSSLVLAELLMRLW